MRKSTPVISTILAITAIPQLSLAQSGAAEIPIDTGTTAWMLISTALVLLMIPGLAMFYGGLVRT
jgi:Amt family ammonium transporter